MENKTTNIDVHHKVCPVRSCGESPLCIEATEKGYCTPEMEKQCLKMYQISDWDDY